MPPRILLVRHGPSAHVHDGRWMDRHGVPRFEDAYDAAGIRDDPPPPEDLRSIGAAADVVCASDLRRAIESASRVAPGRELVISSLLREIRLEPPRWMPFRLPIAAWDAYSHAQWSYRLLTKRDHAFRATRRRRRRLARAACTRGFDGARRHAWWRTSPHCRQALGARLATNG